jgi:mannan endo-1,4-beta-mannosidase
MNPDLGLDPTEPDPSNTPTDVAPEVPVEEVDVNNGRIVGGNCTLVCSNGSTDPDAQGLTDGWGYESSRSCITPESELALASPLCSIAELLPVPALPPEVPAGNVPRPAGNLSTGFFVSGGRLFDQLGNDFVMRGINHPVAWFQANAIDWMEQIATTGANSVRIVWETTRGDPAIVRASIERAVELGMVPMVELHDVTGGSDVNQPAQMAQYYVDEMRDILLEFEPYLLVNIANEWGAWESTAEEWVQAYRPAISILRDAGINHTLVIDANDNGQRGATIVAEGAGLLEADPQHNLLFSTHMYQAYTNPQSIRDVMRAAQRDDVPLIVGEFGFQHGEPTPIAVPYTAMVDEAARIGLGYLAWSWTGNSQNVGYLDMSVSGSASELTGWGDDIINGQNGIRSTAQPASIFTAP